MSIPQAPANSLAASRVRWHSHRSRRLRKTVFQLRPCRRRCPPLRTKVQVWVSDADCSYVRRFKCVEPERARANRMCTDSSCTCWPRYGSDRDTTTGCCGVPWPPLVYPTAVHRDADLQLTAVRISIPRKGSLTTGPHFPFVIRTATALTFPL